MFLVNGKSSDFGTNWERFDSSHRGKQIGHGDWLTDEVRLSDTGMVIHEIEFEEGIWVKQGILNILGSHF
jgi:hypothetical protein